MLKEIVRERVAVAILHGASLYEFESIIEDFRDVDVCYASLGVFPMVEDFILSKIGKRLEIVMDCASVPESLVKNYENTVRIPKLTNFLSREENNCWITAHGHIRDLKNLGFGDFTEAYKHKTYEVDDLFPKEQVPYYMNVPNSATLLIASLLYAGANKIVVLGMDGCKEYAKTLSSYFHPEIIEQERKVAMDAKLDAGIVRDTDAFEVAFPKLYKEYLTLFNTRARIINCSIDSAFTILPKIPYSALKTELITKDLRTT